MSGAILTEPETSRAEWGERQLPIKQATLSEICGSLLEAERMLDKASHTRSVKESRRLAHQALVQIHDVRGIASRVIINRGEI